MPITCTYVCKMHSLDDANHMTPPPSLVFRNSLPSHLHPPCYLTPATCRTCCIHPATSLLPLVAHVASTLLPHSCHLSHMLHPPCYLTPATCRTCCIPPCYLTPVPYSCYTCYIINRAYQPDKTSSSLGLHLKPVPFAHAQHSPKTTQYNERRLFN